MKVFARPPCVFSFYDGSEPLGFMVQQWASNSLVTFYKRSHIMEGLPTTDAPNGLLETAEDSLNCDGIQHVVIEMKEGGL